MSIEENKRLALSVLDMISANDQAGLSRLIADDVHWEVPGNWPQGKIVIDKARFLLGAQEMHDRALAPIQFTVLGVTAEGERVAVEATCHSPFRNGKTYQNIFHWLFVVRDGKVVLVKEYMDTAHAMEVLSDTMSDPALAAG